MTCGNAVCWNCPLFGVGVGGGADVHVAACRELCDMRVRVGCVKNRRAAQEIFVPLFSFQPFFQIWLMYD